MTRDASPMNRIICSWSALEAYRSNSHRGLSGWSFLPVCQYPVEWDVEKNEQGALVKLRGDVVSEVYGRLFCGATVREIDCS